MEKNYGYFLQRWIHCILYDQKHLRVSFKYENCDSIYKSISKIKKYSMKKQLRDNVRIKLQIYRDKIENWNTMKKYICTQNVIFYVKSNAKASSLKTCFGDY